MKILMTTDTVGGVWTYSLQLAKSLARYDVTVDLATLGPPLDGSKRQEAAMLSNVSLHESSYRLEWMADPWEDVRLAGRWLLRLADSLQPDLIHLNDYSQGALQWPRPVLVVGHSCVLSWHQAVRGTSAGSEWDQYRDSVTRGLRGADLVAAPTAAMLTSLQSHYGPFAQSCVLPNGRDPVPQDPAVKQPFVLTAGRLWDDAKNIATLDAAAASIEWPVYAAGCMSSPDGGDASFSGVQPLGVLNTTTMNEWLRAAAIYVHPARYEPFGLVPLEAAQRHCALVLGDIPTLREIWQDAAMFVSPDDPGELATLINRLIEEPSLRTAYAERACARSARFTADQMARRYLAAYQSLIEAPSETPSSAQAKQLISHMQQDPPGTAAKIHSHIR
jgi:glycogen synthase